jgi:hypothetical protein
MRFFEAKAVRYRGDVLLLHSYHDRDISEYGRLSSRANEAGSSAEPDKEMLGKTIAYHAWTILGEGQVLAALANLRRTLA